MGLRSSGAWCVLVSAWLVACKLDTLIEPLGVQSIAGATGTDTRNAGQDAPPYDEAKPGDAGSADRDAGDSDDAGPTSTPADPCSRAHGGCDALVACYPVQGRARCGECPRGYEDVRGDGTLCRDIDECERDNGGCDREHGSCVNRPGTRECKCKPGFHGDGTTCSTNVPCTSDAACSADARCEALAASLVCVCRSGYRGNGQSCSDIDECAEGTHACAAPGVCVNSAGGYGCMCPGGYSGTGQPPDLCLDIDECADDTDDCDATPDACVNEAPGFRCECPRGYRGNGRGPDGCRDIDECADDTDDCDASPDACVNDVPGFHCRCPEGYRGNGRGGNGCVDIDECATRTSNCDARRQCINEPGGFRCGACPAGFRTDGPTGCAACACYQVARGDSCRASSATAPQTGARQLTDDRNISAGTLFGFQVRLPDRAHITGFGAYKGNDGTPQFSMGLYADAGGSPGARVVSSTSGRFAGQRITLGVAGNTNDCLTGGTYWLLAVADADFEIAEAEDGPEVPFASEPLEGAARLPARWPEDGDIDTSRAVGLYVTYEHPQ